MKMTKEKHLELVEAWWKDKLEICRFGSNWEGAKLPPDPLCDSSHYRIRPQPKLRPWVRDEVPLGAQIKSFDGNDRSIIVAVNCQQFWIGSGGAPIPFGFAMEHFVHSLDGGKTWKPCGVEE